MERQRPGTPSARSRPCSVDTTRRSCRNGLVGKYQAAVYHGNITEQDLRPGRRVTLRRREMELAGADVLLR